MVYKLVANMNGVLWTDDQGITRCVPNDSANRDWQAYQTWLAADPANHPLPLIVN